jgi:3-isopropylmalate dehydrogenase
MTKKITVIKGDGIGPEIINEAVKILDKIAQKHSHVFEYNYALMGGAAIDELGDPCPLETVDVCIDSDAVLLGEVGGTKWDFSPEHMRPKTGLLTLKEALGISISVRPVKLFPVLQDACPLKKNPHINMVIVDNLFGKNQYDTARTAFELARKRAKKVTSINACETAAKVRMEDYPDIELTEMPAEKIAAQLIYDPAQFDVVLCERLFGDIIAAQSGMLTGSVGMLSQASVNGFAFGLYEPVHVSEPDIAGRDIANPLAAILSAAMMLRVSFGLEKEADEIESAVTRVLKRGYRTVDITHKNESGVEIIGCSRMGTLIENQI